MKLLRAVTFGGKGEVCKLGRPGNMPGGRNKRGTPREVVLGGGHGPRRSTARVTPSGRQRNAPQWSTAAALAMDGALQMCVEREGGRRISFIRALLCDRVPAGFFKRVRQLSSKRDEQRVRDIVASHRSRLPEGAALPLLTLEAKSLASTMAPYYRGVGSVEQLGVAPAPAEAGSPESASLEQVRGRPDLKVGWHSEKKDSRQVERLREWGVMGAGWCPPHAAATMAAMSNNVRKWEEERPASKSRETPPRHVLLKAARSGEEAPTCARSASYHVWWIREGRRLTVGELLCLMGVATGARLFMVLTNPSFISPPKALGAIGDGVHVGACVAVLRRARELGARLKLGATGKWLRAKGPLRYASSCSGVDFFAQALLRVYGVGGWSYVAACESDERSRRILLEVYGGDGLREEAIAPDARDVDESCEIVAKAGGDLDLWVFTPPCRAFSPLNRQRSWARSLGDLEAVRRMFRFAHASLPNVVVLENVAASESVAAISSIVVGLASYQWYGQKVLADTHAGASIRRERHFWVGIKR